MRLTFSDTLRSLEWGLPIYAVIAMSPNTYSFMDGFFDTHEEAEDFTSSKELLTEVTIWKKYIKGVEENKEVVVRLKASVSQNEKRGPSAHTWFVTKEGECIGPFTLRRYLEHQVSCGMVWGKYYAFKD